MSSAGVVTGTLSLSAYFQEYITSGLINPDTLSVALGALGTATGSLSFTNGTASGLIDTVYWKPLTLSGATTTVNFQSFTDPGGASCLLARSRVFFVYNPSVTAGYDCKIYQAASNPWVMVPPSSSPAYARYGGGWYMLVDPTSTGSSNGNVITSGSCEVTFDPGANTITVYVINAGGSVA